MLIQECQRCRGQKDRGTGAGRRSPPWGWTWRPWGGIPWTPGLTSLPAFMDTCTHWRTPALNIRKTSPTGSAFGCRGGGYVICNLKFAQIPPGLLQRSDRRCRYRGYPAGEGCMRCATQTLSITWILERQPEIILRPCRGVRPSPKRRPRGAEQ